MQSFPTTCNLSLWAEQAKAHLPDTWQTEGAAVAKYQTLFTHFELNALKDGTFLVISPANIFAIKYLL